MACPASDRRLWSDPDSGSANRPNQCKNLLTMGKRGRRPHPDILTPREWEVLDLLRERLTNEQIAERLGITLDGAKYHVSEILSKLGVATREEAAAWRAARAPRWPRLILPQAAAKIAAIAILVAAAAGLAALAWGVAETDRPGGDTAPADWSTLPAPEGEAALTRDAALLFAFRAPLGPDVMPAEATVVLTTFEGAREATDDRGEYGPEGPAADTATCLIRLRGMFTERTGVFSSGPGFPPPAQTAPPTIECREIVVFFADDGPSYVNSDGSPGLVQIAPGNRSSSGSCPSGGPGGSISRDYALVAAAFNPAAQVQRGPPPVRDASAAEMTYAEALDRLVALGWTPPPRDGGPAREDDVWLVALKGSFLPPAEETPPSPPGPSAMRLVCTETISVVDAKTGTVAHTQARTASGCFPARRGDQIVTPAMGQTPAIDQSIAIEAAFRQAGIPSGQEPSSVDAKPSSFTDSLALSYWCPPTDRPKTVWIVTMTGFISRPLDPAAPAPATPPPSEPRCSELLTIVSGDTGKLFASIFQDADSCS